VTPRPGRNLHLTYPPRVSGEVSTNSWTIIEKTLPSCDGSERVRQVIDKELRWAVQQARQDGADRGALADVIFKLAGEVRQRLGLQLAISRTLVDLRVVKEFQETVLETIRDEAPETARRILCTDG
jgi:hypothetical protein